MSLTALRKKRRKKQQVRAPKFPVIEVIDIRVTAQNIALVKTFEKITRWLWFIRWISNTVLVWTNFGGNAALGEGINLQYNDELLLDVPITANFHFPLYAFDKDEMIDSAATKNQMIISRWSAFKFVPEGINLTDKKRTFEVIINDDLSAVNTQMLLVVQGWRY